MQYIERVNTVEAIQIKGDIVKDVIPFLNEHNIEYTLNSGTLEKRSSLMVRSTTPFVHDEPMSETKRGDYILVRKMIGIICVTVMSEDDFNNTYQPSSEVLNNKPSDKEQRIVKNDGFENGGFEAVKPRSRVTPTEKPTVSRDKSNHELEEMIRNLNNKINSVDRKASADNTNVLAKQSVLESKVNKYNFADNTSTPHIRMEFDDIHDVPKVLVDGKRVDKELSRVNVNWNTNTEVENYKSFNIEWFERDGEDFKIKGAAQDNFATVGLSKEKSHERN